MDGSYYKKKNYDTEITSLHGNLVQYPDLSSFEE